MPALRRTRRRNETDGRRFGTQGRAAEIAGLSRVEFIDALDRYRVSPLQYDADEVIAEAGGAPESEGVERLVACGAGEKLRPGKPRGASVRFSEGGPLVSELVRDQRG